MKIRIVLLVLWAWVILASPVARALQAALWRHSGLVAIHTPLLIKTMRSLSAVELVMLLVLGTVGALLARPRRRYERRIDLDTSLAETITTVRAWAAHERISLHGYEPDAPSVRLRGEAPALRCCSDQLSLP